MPQGDIAGHQAGRLSGPGTHTAAGDEDGWDIHAGSGFQMCRDGFITAAGKDHAVPGHGTGVNLYHIGDRFTGGEYEIHAVVSLCAAVTDIGGVIVSRKPAPFKDADLGLFCKLVKMDAARMGIAVYIFDHDLGFCDVGVIPAAAHFEGIELGPPQTLFCTFLFHEDLLGNVSIVQHFPGAARRYAKSVYL